MVDPVSIIKTEARKYSGDDRPVFIGQAPSKSGDPHRPLTGSVGRRLAGLSGMTPMEFYCSTVRVNIVSRFHGRVGTTDVFPMRRARINAVRMAEVIDGRTVVFVGRKVAEAFGCRSGWFEWEDGLLAQGGNTIRFRYAVIQHPSGRNRFWNLDRNVQEARKFLSELMMAESSVPTLVRLRERGRAVDEARGQRATKSRVRGEPRDTGADRLQEHHGGEGQEGPREVRAG